MMLLTIGTRESKLALKQTEFILSRLKYHFPFFQFKITPLTTPGDKDKETSLESNIPDNFFTKDIDEAVLNNSIDLAVHSAKDLPDYQNTEIDWFWWPEHEETGDVLILNKKIDDFKKVKTIGISSPRRKTYAQKYFPNAKTKSIRGNIEERIQKLDSGEFDMIILAAAGLNRLGLANRISSHIPLNQLPPPPGQGHLAITFRKDNKIMQTIRSLFIFPAKFVGAGPGFKGYLTDAGKKAIKESDVCLHDALISDEVLEIISKHSEKVPVGKRSGKHSISQNEINDLIARFTKQGKKVVRLKGGDPNIFGRLDEELSCLKAQHLPFQVIPGITSAQALQEAGILLTKRNSNYHIVISSARNQKNEIILKNKDPFRFSSTVQVIYMGIEKASEVANELITLGYSKTFPVAVASQLSLFEQTIWQGDLGTLTQIKKSFPKPGIIVLGKHLNEKITSPYSPLLGKRILLTGTCETNRKAARRCREWGAYPTNCSLLKPVLNKPELVNLKSIQQFDYVMITSPTGAKMFHSYLKEFKIDIRKVPQIIVLGYHTASYLRKIGFQDFMMPSVPSTKGLIESFSSWKLQDRKVLLMVSELASPVENELLKQNIKPFRCNLYLQPNVSRKLPLANAVMFFSSEAVKRFVKISQKQNYSLEELTFAAIGEPTAKTFYELSGRKCIIADEHNASKVVDALALEMLKKDHGLQTID